MVNILKMAYCFFIVIGIVLAAPATEESTNESALCTKSDPKLDECLKKSLQSAVPLLANGISSFGLSPVDPLRIESLEIDKDSGPVSIKLNFTDLDISNIGTAKINDVNADIHNNNITLDVDFEKPITLDGNYDVKGNDIILPISGDGKSKISLDNLRAKINLQLEPVVRDENTYMEIQQLTFNFTTSRMQITLDNLLKGDEVLEENMNTNDSWKNILNELQSSFENALATALSGVAQQIFLNVPLNEILKD